jgi:hypothetical protein
VVVGARQLGGFGWWAVGCGGFHLGLRGISLGICDVVTVSFLVW